jgi:hypothetical protein
MTALPSSTPLRSAPHSLSALMKEPTGLLHRCTNAQLEDESGVIAGLFPADHRKGDASLACAAQVLRRLTIG